MRYRFLKEHRGDFGPIKKACGLMRVSRSGYYEYLGRKKSNQQIEREALEGFVKNVFFEHKGRYGHRRINLELKKIGIDAGEKRVLKIMRAKELQAKATTRRYRIRRRVEKGNPRINLIERAFTVSEKTGSGSVTSPTCRRRRAFPVSRP